MNNAPRRNPPFFNWLTILIGLLLAVLLLGSFWAALLIFREPGAAAKVSDAAITVVAAPTLTPVISMPAAPATPTPTPGSQGGVPAPNGSIAVGVYVQISGTGGSGLRLRAQPGTSSQSLFLGMESEVYQVQDGPQQKDGFTWFYLVAPYDKNRSGWAASNYLTVIQKPTP